MSFTKTVADTVKTELDVATPGRWESAMQQLKLGTLLKAAIDTGVTTQSAAATVTLSPAALFVQSVEITSGQAGTAATGVRTIGNTASTTSSTVVQLSADGTTLTFEGTVTEYRVVYIPIPAVLTTTDEPSP